MTFRLPSSAHKRYLTGIDWVIHTLDSMTRKVTGHGNSSQIVLLLDGRVDPDRLRSLISKQFQQLPVLCGRTARHWNLCPYWKFGKNCDKSVPVSVVNLPDADFSEAFAAVEKHVQQPFEGSTEHLHFQVVNYDRSRSLVAMHFDHRLFDALGIELFLEMLARSGTDSCADILPQIELTEPAHLDYWIQRFVSGRNVNRLQVRLSRGGVVALPIPNTPKPRTTHFEPILFSPEQGKKIRETATRESGPLMILPALMARVLYSLHQVISDRGLITAGRHYVIPVSIVRRNPGEIWRKLFFNHLSFLIFQIPVETVARNEDLVGYIRESLYSQIQNNVPEDINHASMLTRIAPLNIMRLFTKIPMKGRVGTGYFACLKESGFKHGSLLGVDVENILHTPHVPPPPGIGVFLNFYGDRFNVVLSHMHGILSGEEAMSLTTELRRAFAQMVVQNSVV